MNPYLMWRLVARKAGASEWILLAVIDTLQEANGGNPVALSQGDLMSMTGYTTRVQQTMQKLIRQKDILTVGPRQGLEKKYSLAPKMKTPARVTDAAMKQYEPLHETVALFCYWADRHRMPLRLKEDLFYVVYHEDLFDVGPADDCGKRTRKSRGCICRMSSTGI